MRGREPVKRMVQKTYFKQKKAAADFYDSRYAKGYMEQWPADKKERIGNVIKNLDLPETGSAIDFGCGNGVFTDVIKQALPKWNVCGTDISSVAIKNARRMFPRCNFFDSAGSSLYQHRFDFLFSHHVLEHVYDVSKTWDEMNRFMKAAAGMLHILPCGNEGSFEHRICRMVKGGIADDAGKRFFFEDEGHLRRLNTGQVDVFAGRHGLVLKKQYYNYHYIGAIDWITQSSEAFILEFADPAKAIDRYAAQQLKKLRKKLLCVHKLRRVGSFSLKEKMNPRDFIKIPLLMPLYVFSRTFNICFRALVQSEWKRKKEDPRGSEMYLYYVRTGNYI